MAFIAIEAILTSFWNSPFIAPSFQISWRGIRIARYLRSRLRLMKLSRYEALGHVTICFFNTYHLIRFVLCIIPYLLIRVKTLFLHFRII